MNRPLTALFAALEALLVVGVGIGITLAPLTLMWAFEYGLQVDWVVFWRAAVDVWLIGHGVDVAFALDPAVAAASGLPGAAEAFTVTVALLGFALVTLLLAVRAGRRIGETPHRLTGHLVSVATVAALGAAVTLSASTAAATPVLWQAIVLPALVFVIGTVIGSTRASAIPPLAAPGAVPAANTGSTPRADRSTIAPAGDRAASWFAGVAADVRTRADAALPVRVRRTLGSLASVSVSIVAGILAVSAVTVAVLLAMSYGQIIGLYEAVQSGYLGGVALTIGQLAALPDLVVWAASWFIGPGFAIGSGSTVSPLGTVVGPIPAIPMLGAVPEAAGEFAFIGLLVPVVVAFVAAALVRRRLVGLLPDSRWALAAAGAAIGAIGGVVLALLAWLASGSAGPGRLVEVGPDWLAVGGWGALEIAVPAILALLVGGVDFRALPERVRERGPDPRRAPETEPRSEPETAPQPEPEPDTAPEPDTDLEPERERDPRSHAR